jgi:hypothetical protein
MHKDLGSLSFKALVRDEVLLVRGRELKYRGYLGIRIDGWYRAGPVQGGCTIGFQSHLKSVYVTQI